MLRWRRRPAQTQPLQEPHQAFCPRAQKKPRRQTVISVPAVAGADPVKDNCACACAGRRHPHAAHEPEPGPVEAKRSPSPNSGARPSVGGRRGSERIYDSSGPSLAGRMAPEQRVRVQRQPAAAGARTSRTALNRLKTFQKARTDGSIQARLTVSSESADGLQSQGTTWTPVDRLEPRNHAWTTPPRVEK